MSKRSLYKEMDEHLNKIYSTDSSEKKKKGRSPIFPKIKSFMTSIKEYFFPKDEFEHKQIDGENATIVSKIDKGFKCHKKKVINYFKEKKSKKSQIDQEPEDVDISLVKEVIRKNKKSQ